MSAFLAPTTSRIAAWLDAAAVRVQPAEWMLTITALYWTAWLTFDPRTFADYGAYAGFAPRSVMVLVLAVTSTLHLVGVVKPRHRDVRRAALILSSAVWAYTAVMFLAVPPLTTAEGVYPALSTGGSLAAVWLSRGVR